VNSVGLRPLIRALADCPRHANTRRHRCALARGPIETGPPPGVPLLPSLGRALAMS